MSESENLEKIFSLVKNILNAKPEENEWIKNFDSLVKNDFHRSVILFRA